MQTLLKKLHNYAVVHMLTWRECNSNKNYFKKTNIHFANLYDCMSDKTVPIHYTSHTSVPCHCKSERLVDHNREQSCCSYSYHSCVHFSESCTFVNNYTYSWDQPSGSPQCPSPRQLYYSAPSTHQQMLSNHAINCTENLPDIFNKTILFYSHKQMAWNGNAIIMVSHLFIPEIFGNITNKVLRPPFTHSSPSHWAVEKM